VGQQYTASQQAILNQLFAAAAVGAIPGAWLQDNTVTGDKLAPGGIDGSKLTDASISESKLARVQRRIDDERLGGGTRVFNLAREPVSPACLLVSYNTTLMSRQDYVLSGSTVTLNFDPVAGSQIRFNYDAWFLPTEVS